MLSHFPPPPIAIDPSNMGGTRNPTGEQSFLFSFFGLMSMGGKGRRGLTVTINMKNILEKEVERRRGTC